MVLQIDREKIQEYCEALMAEDELVKAICKKRGLKKSTLKLFEIGYEHSTRRYTIPVRDATGSYVNVRKYSIDSEPKIISYAEGYGENRIFMITTLKKNKDNKNIVITEGEWDCIMANSHGFKAICGTCGASSWKEEWSTYFEGKNVFIIYDCDKAGREGSKKVGDMILPYANMVKIIDLGLGDNGEDLTDWFTTAKKDLPELVSKIKTTEPLDPFEMVDLAAAMDSEYVDKRIKWHGICCGKDMSPYLVPRIIEARCTGSGDAKSCEFCPLASIPGRKRRYEYTYERDKESIVRFVNIHDRIIQGYMRQDLGIPSSAKCRSCHVEVLERQLIEDISIIPEVDFKQVADQEYVTRRAYVWGSGVQTNATYIYRGTTFYDPSTQRGIQLVIDKKNIMDQVSKFVIDEEVKKIIKKFQPEKQNDRASIWEKINEIYTDLQSNVTQIYGRKPIMFATDLVYHSVLNFMFSGRLVGKGWLECAVVGDTRTGKTQTVKSLMQHYRAGEFITSGENTTRAGLLGGAQQTNNRWMLTWGKIPLNDRKLLAIDEADNLREKGIIGLLSGVRSSGVAEITMVQSQRTTARTRLIWIANPSNGRVSEYNYGIEIVKELFEKQQDIARCDFALCAAKEDVPAEKINKPHNEKIDHVYTSESCHARIMWAWNRKADHIMFIGDAEEKIFNYANEFGEKYHPSIPLVIDAEMRVKIARMAVALATMMVSTDDDCNDVLVYGAHVDVVVDFLRNIYDSKVMGYSSYSEQMIKSNQLDNKQFIDETINTIKIIDILLSLDEIQNQDIVHIFNCHDRDSANKLVRKLIYAKAFKKQRFSLRKTPQFIKYLKWRQHELNKKIGETSTINW